MPLRTALGRECTPWEQRAQGAAADAVLHGGSLARDAHLTPLEPSVLRSLNVLGQPLVPCSHAPRTGWFRDGCCNTDENDRGLHTVCAQVTQEFLEFLAMQGNDLITPAPQYGFPGLTPGDQWCVVARSWRQAYEAGKACPVILESTHQETLKVVSLEALMAHAIGMGEA